ncbi:unnamed protein product [Ectocarpus sp. 12 AP-2014]
MRRSGAAVAHQRRSYHDNIVEHYENPRNVGSMDKKDKFVGTGLVGAPACGDVMKLQIKVSHRDPVAMPTENRCGLAPMTAIARSFSIATIGSRQDEEVRETEPRHGEKTSKSLLFYSATYSSTGRGTI